MESIIQKLPFEKFRKLPEDIQDARMWLRLSEAISGQWNLESQRLASINKQKIQIDWNFVLLERYGREQVWVIFRPEDLEKAKLFHSYQYFKNALKDGCTVLALIKYSSWNVLSEDDTIIGELAANITPTSWNIRQRGMKLEKKFGI